DKGIDANNGCSYVTVYMNVTRNSTTNPNCNIVPYFQVSGTSGTRLLATTSEEFGNMGIAGYDDGSGENSINDDACAKNVIAVGAYCTRPSWITLRGTSYTYTDTPTNGDIADFSSYGVTLDGRNLPHLAGPGYGIISAYSQYYYTNANLGNNDVSGYVNANGRDNYWANEQGTSMSSPYVAGVGCLLLQANPSLTPEELRNILIETATKDDFVNNGNEVQWGAGKVNALAAVKKALDMGGVGTVYADENLRLIVSPAGNKCYDVFLAGVDGFKATLYSLSGVAVKSVAIDGNEGAVDASELSSGIYVMEVKADNAHFTKKIVVK
ncbi:MAG: S8 family peptidase, partial [Muribaculaceae bacterium]